jgi:hypothetical protein
VKRELPQALSPFTFHHFFPPAAHGFQPFNRRLFPTTLTLLKAMAALAMIGERRMPKAG